MTVPVRVMVVPVTVGLEGETLRNYYHWQALKILIEQQFHAERGIRTIRCSRSAA